MKYSTEDSYKDSSCLLDENVGVVPLSATKEIAHVGSMVMVKWNRTLYVTVLRRVQE